MIQEAFTIEGGASELVLRRRLGLAAPGRSTALGNQKQQRVVELLGEVREAVLRRVGPQIGQDVEHLSVVLGQIHRSILLFARTRPAPLPARLASPMPVRDAGVGGKGANPPESSACFRQWLSRR